MKHLKTLAIVGGAFTASLVAACLIPGPPQGLWTGRGISCMCGNHTTLRVRNNEVALFTYCGEGTGSRIVNDQLTKQSGGDYVWLRYGIGASRTNSQPFVITNTFVLSPRLLVMSFHDGSVKRWLIRDFAIWRANATMDKCGEPVDFDTFLRDHTIKRDKEKTRPTEGSTVQSVRGMLAADEEQQTRHGPSAG